MSRLTASRVPISSGPARWTSTYPTFPPPTKTKRKPRESVPWALPRDSSLITHRSWRAEARTAGVAAGDRAPLGQQLRQVERVDAPIRHHGRTGDVRDGEIRRRAVLARRARRVRVAGTRTPRPEHGPEVKRVNASIGHTKWAGDVGHGDGDNLKRQVLDTLNLTNTNWSTTKSKSRIINSYIRKTNTKCIGSWYWPAPQKLIQVL